MAKITYINKQTPVDKFNLKENEKFSASDANEIKDAVNYLYDNGGSISGGTGADLTNYYTKPEINSKGYLTAVTYSEITGRPSIPTNTSDLTNNSGYVTSTIVDGQLLLKANVTDVYTKANSDSRYATESFVTGKNYLTGFTATWSALTGKPTFANIATSGSYLDLINTPSIPSISGLTSTVYVDNQLLLKANSTDVYTKVISDSKYSLTAHTHTFSNLTAKPTTLSGYGITDAPTLSGGVIPSAFLPESVLSPNQFETLPDGTIGIKTSYLQSLGLGGGTGYTQLGAPAVFVASGATSSSVNLAWSATTNATSYQLQRASNSGYTGSTVVYSGTSTSFINTGLTASSNYFYRVKASASGYTDSSYSTASVITLSASTGSSTNYMTGFSPVLVLSGLTSGASDTTTSGSTIYIQGNTSAFNSTQNFHIPASAGGELAVRVQNITSTSSCGLVDNYQLSNPYGFTIIGDKVYQKNGSQEYLISGTTLAVGDFVILKTLDDNTGGSDNNALRYYKIFKSSDGGTTRTELTLPQGSNYNNSTTKFIAFLNEKNSILAYPQAKGLTA